MGKRTVPEEYRICQGLHCEEVYQIRRNAQKYCSVKCEQSITRLRKYNLTKKRWWEIYHRQGGKCICGELTTKWHIDHDHSCCPPRSSCGDCIRGLLCDSCNHALGKARDSPEILRALAHYIESSRVR